LPSTAQHIGCTFRPPPLHPSSSERPQDFLDVEHGNTPHTEHSQAGKLPEDDLVNFAIASPSDAGQSTPSGRPSTSGLSSTSMTWVDEMNAELAEFDSLTSGLRPGSLGTPEADSGRRKQRQQAQR
jgi:hypothetical protein